MHTGSSNGRKNCQFNLHPQQAATVASEQIPRPKECRLQTAPRRPRCVTKGGSLTLLFFTWCALIRRCTHLLALVLAIAATASASTGSLVRMLRNGRMCAGSVKIFSSLHNASCHFAEPSILALPLNKCLYKDAVVRCHLVPSPSCSTILAFPKSAQTLPKSAQPLYRTDPLGDPAARRLCQFNLDDLSVYEAPPSPQPYSRCESLKRLVMSAVADLPFGVSTWSF